MTWVDTYAFREPLEDLRGDDAQAGALAAELLRDVDRGHPLHGKAIRVVARAWRNDDVIVACDDAVAVVHLTWTGRRDRPPWPLVTPLASTEDLRSRVAQYDREP